MSWLEITVQTDKNNITSVVNALTAGGFSDLVIEDQQELEGFLEENRDYWDYIDESLQSHLQGLSHVKLYLEDTDSSGMHRLDQLLARLELTKTVAPLPDVDYSESWKDSYPPQPIGNRLLVLPYWLADSDSEGREKIILDPGLTFGTGAHPSTQMVMEAMEELVQPGCSCLDLGSGSGILSIAGLRLGAKSAIGVDIDPKAEDIARENAAYNGFHAPAFTALTGNVTSDRALMQTLSQQSYDVVLVNIVADVIIGLAPTLPHFLGETSKLICSGILDTRLEEVKKALHAAGLEILSVRSKEDWRCIVAERKKP